MATQLERNLDGATFAACRIRYPWDCPPGECEFGEWGAHGDVRFDKVEYRQCKRCDWREFRRVKANG